MLLRTTSQTMLRGGWLGLLTVLVATGGQLARAGGPNVSFDFARVAEYRDVTPDDRATRYPNERLVEVRLPISVRFTGLASGEVELLDIEIDGSAAGLRVERFSPTTALASDTTSIETTKFTSTTRSIDGTLGGALPVPVGNVVAHVAPSVSAGTAKTNEATERVKRLPPKRSVVVSGTFAEGRGVFFKLKRSTQTTLEGVHELTVTFVTPADWQGGSVRIACTARGHHSRWWYDKPATFGRVVDAIELYAEADADGRAAASRRAELERAADEAESCRWASFVSDAKAEVKKAADKIVDVDF